MQEVRYDNIKNLIISGKMFINKSVKFTNSTNIKVTNCNFIGSQLYFIKCVDSSVLNNTFEHSANKATQSHAVQFNQCTGGVISYNFFSEAVGGSNLSDIISLYKSNGTSAKNIVVEGNYLVGGGPSTTGGGIMLGDNEGSYQIARNNILINPGQYGVAIAGGNYNSIIGNTVLSKQYSWSNVGIYVWGVDARKSIVKNATVQDNKVSWTNKKGMPNPWWYGSNVYGLTIKNNTTIIYPSSVPKKPPGVGADSKIISKF